MLDSIGGGYKESIKSKFSEFNSHIEVYNYDNEINSSSAYEIINFLKNKEVLNKFSFLSQENGIARLGDKAQSLFITSVVDGGRDIYKALYSEENLLCCDSQIILGAEVKNQIKANLNKQVYLFSLHDFIHSGTVYQRAVKPNLINYVNFGIPEYNNHFAQIDSDSFKKLFGHNDIHKILIDLKDGVDYVEVSNELESYFNTANTNYSFLSFDERYEGLYSALNEIFKSISIIMFFLILICLLNVLSTTSLIIKSKIRQIKILRISGMSSLNGYFIFVFIALLAISASSIFGLFISLLLLLLQNSFQLITLSSDVYFVDRLYGVINFSYLCLIYLFLLISGAIASFLMAQKSSFNHIKRI